jgi:hypothetical protein
MSRYARDVYRNEQVKQQGDPMQNEPIMDVAHLAHLEIFSPVPD